MCQNDLTFLLEENAPGRLWQLYCSSLTLCTFWCSCRRRPVKHSNICYYGGAFVIIKCISMQHQTVTDDSSPTPPEPVPDPAVGSGLWPWLPVVDRNPGPNKEDWLKTHNKSTRSCNLTFSCPRGRMYELYLQDEAFQEDRVPVRVHGNVCKSPPSFSQQILAKQWLIHYIR